MIKLHVHTSESDGTLCPADVILKAKRAGVTVLAVTDHDTFSGYDAAVSVARQYGVELVCGIELSTKFEG